ncbi:Cna B-type domain-containing protein [Clostridiales bacterium COT073_COT-073]|nr:Cna B-type domain-containing protein [Clostridiales bacterium COT073_COT-073]
MKEMKNNWQTYLIKAIGFAFALCLLQLGFISTAQAYAGDGEIRVTKIWENQQPAVGEVKVVVQGTIPGEDLSQADLNNLKYEFTLDDANSWVAEINTAVTEYNGKKVEYDATEITQVPDYTSGIRKEKTTVPNPVAGSEKTRWTFIVTNSKTPLEPYNPPQPDPEPQPDQYRRMTLTKEWVGGEPEGVEEVLVQVVGTVETMNQLSQDIQDKLTYTFRLTKTDNWTEDLNVLWYVFNPANKVKYTITEVTEVPGYTSQVGELKLVDADPVSQREKEWTCTITNTRTTEESARQLMEITKQWIGDATVDEVVIEAQGRVPGKDLSDNELAALKYTFTLSKANNWKAEQLVMSVWNGAEVVYTLKELTNVPGYTSQVGELKLVDADPVRQRGRHWTCTVTNTKVEESKPNPNPDQPEQKPESKPQSKPDETLGDDGTPTGSTELPKTDGISASVALLMGAMIVSGGYVLRKRK